MIVYSFNSEGTVIRPQLQWTYHNTVNILGLYACSFVCVGSRLSRCWLVVLCSWMDNWQIRLGILVQLCTCDYGCTQCTSKDPCSPGIYLNPVDTTLVLISCRWPISPHLFHSKLKTLLFNKSYPDLSSSHISLESLPFSTPNSGKHHPP